MYDDLEKAVDSLTTWQTVMWFGDLLVSAALLLLSLRLFYKVTAGDFSFIDASLIGLLMFYIAVYIYAGFRILYIALKGK